MCEKFGGVVQKMMNLDQFEEVSNHAQKYKRALQYIRGERKPITITMSELSKSLGITSSSIRKAYSEHKSLPSGNLSMTGRKERFFNLEEATLIRSHFAKNNPMLNTFRPRSQPLSVIGIFGQKGGIKKTTTATNLAVHLSKNLGLKILLVDLDVQGSSTSHFVSPDEYNSYTENQTFAGFLETGEIKPLIQHDDCNQNLDFIPANSHLETLQLKFMARFMDSQTGNNKSVKWGEDWWNLIPDALEQVRQDYDIVVLDTAPRLDIINLSAIFATTDLVLPVPPKTGDIDSIINFIPPLIDSLRKIEKMAHKEKGFNSINHFVAGVDKSKNALMASQVVKIFPDTICLHQMRQSDSVYANDQHFLSLIEDIQQKDFAGSPNTLKALKENYRELFDEFYGIVSRNWLMGV